MTARDRLGVVLAPGMVELIEAMVDERVEARVAELANGNGAAEWLTLEEAGRRLDLSADAVRMLANRKRLEDRYIGRRRYVSRASVDGVAR